MKKANNIPPPKTDGKRGPPRGSGRMVPMVKGMFLNAPYIVNSEDLHNMYDAAKSLNMTLTSSRRNFQGFPKLKPNTLRVWRIK